MPNTTTPSMESKGLTLLVSFPVNGSFYIAIYQGSISDLDVIIKYRQKDAAGNWSRLRTPKHIHWAVDIMIKHYLEDASTNQLLDFLIDWWQNHAAPWTTPEERNDFLKAENLMQIVNAEAQNYAQLAGKGEYSVPFLILLAILLMSQEKTNMSAAYMFGNLLDKLKKHQDIFSIISIATHR